MWLKCSLCSKNRFFTLLSAIFFELPITQTPDNSNLFWFPLKVQVIGSRLYLCKRLYTGNKTNSSYKANVSLRTSVSGFISSNKVSNACSKCIQTVHTRVQAIACLFCNIKRFGAYPWLILGLIKISGNIHVCL